MVEEAVHTLEELVEELGVFEHQEPTFPTLGEQLLPINFAEMEFAHLVPAIQSPNNYARNILTLQPVEVVVLNWPPGVESAIHHHEGFFGYVAVLQGECENVEYKLADGKMRESFRMKGRAGGLIPEKDGVIHKLKNPSATENCVTAHFYYPALESFAGMKIFDIDNGRVGVLNEKADTSSWVEPPEHFASIQENAFEYTPANPKVKSHSIYPVVPKPPTTEIEEMITAYYAEQAHDYDLFDLYHKTRKAYTKCINGLIAEDIKTHCPKNLLALACGTGRRSVKIRKQSECDFDITGIDLSEEMCQYAEERGLKTYCGNWLEMEVPETFDAATFLYAFGHITNKQHRQQVLKKIAKQLNPAAPFYLDVFNLEDQNEWGPAAERTFKENNLANYGYEKGDVFYRKTGGNEVAFLHYFTEEDITGLLQEAGFSVEWVKHIGYVKKSGEILEQQNEGALFIKAVKQ